MARINVDNVAFVDTRIIRLGHLLQKATINIDDWAEDKYWEPVFRTSALGALLLVWNQCTERHTTKLTEEDINLCTGIEGFGLLMSKAGLWNSVTQYILGSEKRCMWKRDKAQSSRENGKKGGRPPKEPEKPTENSNKPTSTSYSYSSSDSTSDKKETPKPPSGQSAFFDKFWTAYPRRVGKRAAQAKWKTLKLNPLLDQILRAVEAQKKTESWRKDNGQFIPHPATWLNRGSWDDEIDVDTSGVSESELEAEIARRKLEMGWKS